MQSEKRIDRAYRSNQQMYDVSLLFRERGLVKHKVSDLISFFPINLIFSVRSIDLQFTAQFGRFILI